MNTLNIKKHVNNVLIEKKLFKIKDPDSKGLLLNITETDHKSYLRIKYLDFHSNGKILALCDSNFDIYFINFETTQCWKLEHLDSCSLIKFIETNLSYQLLIGKLNGVIELIDIDTGKFLNKLMGHENSIISVSFTQDLLCITASKNEAILWDLSNYTKLQVLSIQKECELKFVMFLPVSNNILVCYKDDIIQIWKYGSFENLKQFHPSNWRNYSVRSLTISNNGKIMIVSGYLPILAIFQLDIWKLLKIINLPTFINTVKKVQFVPQNFDGGCNKLLAILTGAGLIYFYDIEQNILITELQTNCEITNFSLSIKNMKYLACLLCSGATEVYDINFLLMKNKETVIENATTNKSSQNKLIQKRFPKKMEFSEKIELSAILNTAKLKSIIKEYEEFPAIYRATIWEKCLKLPHNIQQYNSVVNHVALVAFEDLPEKFPIEDKSSLHCLKHLLNNLCTWCPFFAQVDYLPGFFFPFAKVFHKKPIQCFELCCTIIVNWCQHWFEYYPLPPVNILAILDNILMEHDFQILHYFSERNIKPLIYSWSLMETAFSEVLSSAQWLMLWDHIFINEPSFFLFAIVAFIILQKRYIMLLDTEEEFSDFFHTPRLVDCKKLIRKTYYLLKNTSEKHHPRQYLCKFSSLTNGSYPVFDEYPKDVLNFQLEHVEILENQLKDIKKLKENATKEQESLKFYNEIAVKNEDKRRKNEVEKACLEKIKSFQENLIIQQDELKELREELIARENEILKNSKEILKTNKDMDKVNNLELLTKGIGMSEKIHEIDTRNLETSYKMEQLNLNKKLQLMENDEESGENPELVNRIKTALQQTINFTDQVKKAKKELNSANKADIAITVTAMNDLILKIKKELENDSDYSKENLKDIENETKSLKQEVSWLLRSINCRCSKKKQK